MILLFSKKRWIYTTRQRFSLPIFSPLSERKLWNLDRELFMLKKNAVTQVHADRILFLLKKKGSDERTQKLSVMNQEKTQYTEHVKEKLDYKQ